MRINLAPLAAVVFVVSTILFRVTLPLWTWTWAAVGGVTMVFALLGSHWSTGKAGSRRRRFAGAALVLGVAPLALIMRAHRPSDPVWEHLKAQIRRDIAHGCRGDRGVQARALFETWARAHQPTTIDCAPTHEVGAYGNGLRLGVSIAGRVDPTCATPEDMTYWVGGPELVLHWCEPVADAA